VKQFLPSIAAGALLTCALVRFAEESLWMLPGLWAMLFSLGVFASCRLLPRATFWSGVYYLVAGFAALAFARDAAAFSPWAMVGTFGVGQLLTAGILYFTLERPHVEP
jgi:predicted membrane channel-forming protein YqfA (hemolysin III family)